MTKSEVKEDLKLIDYLKESGISHDEIKKLIDEQISNVLEKEKEEGKEKGEPTPKEKPDPEKVPPISLEDIKELVHEEIKNTLKIKRKIPSKGKIVDNEPESIKDRNKIKRNWSEVLV